MNKKTLLTSLMSIVMLASVGVGATYALFTSETSTNIAINAAKVEVKAEVKNLVTSSMGVTQPEGTFENGGSATINESVLNLDLVSPGDKAEFDVELTNNSNIDIQYRTIISSIEDNGLFSGLIVTVDGNVLKGVGGELVVKSNWESLGQYENFTKPIHVVVELPENVGNEYQTTSTKLSIALSAVQGNAKVYNDAVVANQSELESAVADAKAPTKITLAKGNYNLSTSMANKDIVFAGTKDTVIDTTANLASTNDATVGFEGVTVKFSNTDNYKGLTHTKKVTYTDCTLDGKQFMYAPEVEFVNCVFNNKNDYCVWTYGAKNVTFANCTFNTGGKAILVYNEQLNSNFVANITLSGCVFNSDGSVATDKAAVETGSNANNTATSNKYNLTFTDCTVNGFSANKSSSPLWGNKNSMDTDHLNVIIDGADVY